MPWGFEPSPDSGIVKGLGGRAVVVEGVALKSRLNMSVRNRISWRIEVNVG